LNLLEDGGLAVARTHLAHLGLQNFSTWSEYLADAASAQFLPHAPMMGA
jgi:hypothetical protein